MFGKIWGRKKGGKPSYRVPNATRVYAIGDIHGCRAELETLVVKIAEDCAGFTGEVRIVQLGDMIDRGPDSAGVIEILRFSRLADARLDVIAGNHEEAMLRVLDGTDAPRGWLSFGGMQTLESYGILRSEHFAPGFNLGRRMDEAIPAAHLEFLRGLPDHVTIGDYLFVHAGIRPGLAIEQQDISDLHWIRSSFLESEVDHGRIVVHGHTISPEPEVRDNRIGIDTGCYAGGPLTALVLEGSERRFLQTVPA